MSLRTTTSLPPQTLPFRPSSAHVCVKGGVCWCVRGGRVYLVRASTTAKKGTSLNQSNASDWCLSVQGTDSFHERKERRVRVAAWRGGVAAAPRLPSPRPAPPRRQRALTSMRACQCGRYSHAQNHRTGCRTATARRRVDLGGPREQVAAAFRTKCTWEARCAMRQSIDPRVHGMPGPFTHSETGRGLNSRDGTGRP